MTDDRIAFEGLLEKAVGADFLLEMVAFAADRLMAHKAVASCGTAPHRE